VSFAAVAHFGEKVGVLKVVSLLSIIVRVVGLNLAGE